MFQKRQGGLQANGDDPSPGDLFQEVDLEDQQGQEDDRLGPKKPQKKMPSRAEISITGCYIALYKELYYYGNRYDLERLYYR